MIDEEKIYRQINQISDRIFELNDKIDVTISKSELNKIEKLKKKLVKEKEKLYRKLFPQEDTVLEEPLSEEEE